MGDGYVRMPGAIVLLSAARGMGVADFCASVTDRLPALRMAMGAEAFVRLSARYEVDPLAEIYGERTMATADAILDTSQSQGEPMDLARRLGALSALADVCDFAGSAVGVGTLVYIHRDLPEGGEMLTFLGRRDPAVSQAEMSRWWLQDHVALIRRLQGDMRPSWTYAQLHVDHAASKEASRLIGMPWTEYDMGDLLAIADRKHFLDFHLQPEVGGALAVDEQGHLDQASWRGGLQKVVDASA